MPIRSIAETISLSASNVQKSHKVDEEKLRKACMDFESIFTQHLLKTMRQTVPASEIFGENAGKTIFESFFDQELGRSLAHQRGLGLGKMVYEQMRKRNLGIDAFLKNETVSRLPGGE
jgi:flagellar protein FlgJ